MGTLVEMLISDVRRLVGLTAVVIILCLILSLFFGGGRRIAKRLLKVSSVSIVLMIICSCFINNQHSANKRTPTNEWSSGLFEKRSQVYNKELALVAAKMSEESEDKYGEKIKNLYGDYGISDTELYNYRGKGLSHIVESIGGSAFAIGQGILSISGEDTLILVITVRGTMTAGEMFGDWFKGWEWEKYHDFEGEIVFDNVYDFEEAIWSGLNDYIKKYPVVTESENLKIMINGHSLAGAAACMVGARFNGGIGGDEWWFNKVGIEDIYVYTFGAIKVFETDDNKSVGYENIHNLYNYYDSYGPNGNQSIWNASSPNAKFGHTDLFQPSSAEEETGWFVFSSNVNHQMSIYKDAIENELINCN